jgi:hypothetical protein
MLYLVIFFMMKYSQSFSCSISHSSLDRPPRGGSLNHLANMADMIGRRLVVYDHMYMPEIRVPSKQPQGSNEERGLTITQ